MSRPTQESDALVLGYQEHGESDKIITFYSRDYGRFTGIAKGANRSKRRFVNKLELFSFLHVVFKESANGNLAFVEQAELHNSFLNLRQHYKLFIAASVIQEILLVATSEKERDQDIFALTLWSLHYLDFGHSPQTILLLYLTRLFDLLGYRPDFSACLHCGATVNSCSTFSFNYSTGGLICNNCQQIDRTHYASLSNGTINLLNKALDQKLEHLHRLKLSSTLQKEISFLLQRYAKVLFQKDFQSLRLLNATFADK